MTGELLVDLTVPRGLSERAWQRLVEDVARRFGWLAYHVHDSRRDEPGFPDLVLVRQRVLFRELKAERGRLRPEQRAWGARLLAAGADWAVWRPADWREVLLTLTSEEG